MDAFDVGFLLLMQAATLGMTWNLIRLRRLMPDVAAVVGPTNGFLFRMWAMVTVGGVGIAFAPELGAILARFL